MTGGNIRIRREAGVFMLFHRDDRTLKITDRLYVGDVKGMRELAAFLIETADAFDAAAFLIETADAFDAVAFNTNTEEE